MDAFKKVQPGQRLEISAEAFNTFIDAALDYKAHRHDRTTQAGTLLPDSTFVKVRNNSGADRERFDVLGITGLIITPEQNTQAFKNQVALIGQAPQKHHNRFVILQEPVAAGAITTALVSGMTVAKVNVQAATHGHAEPVDGDCTALRSCNDGPATILWKETGTGLKWAVVLLGGRSILQRFELKTKLSCYDSLATAHPLNWNGSQYVADTNVEFTVHNVLKDGVYYRFAGRGRDSQNGIPGARGIARWCEDTQRWEILQLHEQAQLVLFQLVQDLTHSTTAGYAQVLAYANGYDPAPVAVQGDQEIVVLNHFGAFAGRNGTRGLGVYCNDSPELGWVEKYSIVAMEPNDYDPVTIDVVTQVTTSGYYTRQLRLPAGVSFGSPVWHPF